MNATPLREVWATRSLLLTSSLAALLATANSTLSAADASASPATTNAPTSTATAGSEKPRVHILPPPLEELVKMSEAGVSAEILRKFVEDSGIAYKLTGPDIVVMKQRGLPDEVTVAMMSHGNQLRLAAARGRDTIAAPAIVRTLSTDGEMDPDSYEFFWYHHAYPRILAGSYQRLSPYYPTYPTYPNYPAYGSYYGLSQSRYRGPFRTDGFPRQSFTVGPVRH